MDIKLCDACGKNITNHKSGRKLEYGVHIDTMLSGDVGGLYVDNEMNAISGRSTAWELCNKCYNNVMLPAVKLFHEMRDAAMENGEFKTITL